MDNAVLNRLKNAGLLSEHTTDMGFVSTGSYALNKVISGDYTKGIPIGMITQFHGEASTAKTVFATHILKEAQSQGFYTMLVDSENAYNPEFARSLGIDPEKLIYAAPETLEDWGPDRAGCSSSGQLQSTPRTRSRGFAGSGSGGVQFRFRRKSEERAVDPLSQ